MLKNYSTFVSQLKNINEMAAPRIPNSLDYWTKKMGKRGKDVMLYTHDDMDGIFSAIAIKKYLISKGFNIIGYGIVNYQEGWDVFNIDTEVINVAVDFAEIHPDIDVYIDHHGEFEEGNEEVEKAKKKGATKTETGSAYEGIMDQLGLPIDSLILDVIDMIDSAKYDHYGVKWSDLLEFDFEKFKNDKKYKLVFAAVFNQMLKRGDYRTIIEVIHNVDEPSIYKIFDYMKKLFPGNNPFLKRGEMEEDYGEWFQDPEYVGKDFVGDSTDRLNKMKSRSRGGAEFKGVINSQDEFVEKYTQLISYPEESRSKFAGQEAHVIKLDGYVVIGEIAFFGSGTWANALRARTIIEQDISSGRLPEEAKNTKWVFLQYGDTLQVAAYGNIDDWDEEDFPKDIHGKPIDDLKIFTNELKDNFENKLGFKNKNTKAGGHKGIGTISNIGVSKLDILSTDASTKHMVGLRYVDLFKNYIIKSLSKVPWRLDLSWENPFSNNRVDDPIPVDARVMKTNQIRNINKQTGKIEYPEDYERKESMKKLKDNARQLELMEIQLQKQKVEEQIAKSKAKHEYYKNKKEGDPDFEEWDEKEKEKAIEQQKIENIKDSIQEESYIKFTNKRTITIAKVIDKTDDEVSLEEINYNNVVKVKYSDLLYDKNFDTLTIEEAEKYFNENSININND